MQRTQQETKEPAKEELALKFDSERKAEDSKLRQNGNYEKEDERMIE